MQVGALPSPPGLPLLGHALRLRPTRFHLVMEDWAQRLGPLFRVRIGQRSLVAVGEPELLRAVLRDRPDGFRRLASFEPIFSEMGINGVFSSEGERWKRQRRIWMATLNAQQLRGFHGQLRMVTRRLLRRWRDAADRGAVLDIAAELMRYTVDVTTLFALGHDGNTLEQGDDVIQRHLNQVFPAIGPRIVSPMPYWRYIRLPHDRALDRALRALRTEAAVMIGQARQRLADGAAPACFLDALVAARDDDGSVLSDDDLFANCLTALLGGEDTTATTLAWSIHHLCTAPDVAARLRDEADRVCGDDAPDPATLPASLPWTDAALNETLRLKPIAPVYYLTALRDMRLGALELPAGQHVVLLPRVAAGSAPCQSPAPRYAPRPAEQASEEGAGRAPTLPFGYGPRMCPGRNLALAELRSVSLLLARHFEVEAVPQAQPVRERLSFTLVPEHLRVRLHRRAA